MSQPEPRPGSFAEFVRTARSASSQTTLARMLLGAIAEEQPGETRRRRWRLAGVVALTLAGLAGFAIVWWVVVGAAIYGWQTTNWDPFQAAELAPQFLAFMALVLPILTLFGLPLRRDEIRRVLDAIAAGDQRIAALVTPQPEPLPSPELAPGPESFRRLRALPSWSEDRNFLPLLPPILAQPIIIAFGFLQPALDDGLTLNLFGVPIRDVFAAVGVFSIASYLLVLIFFIRGPGRWRVTADDFGMRWRRGRWRRAETQAPWGSVRSFFAHESYSPVRTAYVLDTSSAVLGWVLTSSSKADENRESERLVRLIVTHTRLPLRYLSPLAPGAAQAQGEVPLPHGPGLETDLLADLARIRRRPIRLVLRGLAIALPLAAVLVAAPLVASNRLQDYQQTYFAGLPPQIHAETPLF